jgi:serine protease Do
MSGGELLAQLNGELAGLAAKVRASLVRVETAGRGTGAGTVWHPDGLILTNAHVVQQRSPRVVLADGRHLPARILAQDRELDLAALAVEAEDLPTIEVGDSRRLRPGSWVVAFGHPWGIESAATAGVIIGQGDLLAERPQLGHRWIAASLHYRPGHSGGPLVDAGGRLVGINTVMAGPDVGLAVPVQEVKGFLKRRLGGEHPRPESQPQHWA